MSKGYYRGNLERQMKDAQKAFSSIASPEEQEKFLASIKEEPKVDKPASPVLLASEQSKQSGYTGDPCPNCQSLTLRVSGHCAVCDTCGETTGCS